MKTIDSESIVSDTSTIDVDLRLSPFIGTGVSSRRHPPRDLGSALVSSWIQVESSYSSRTTPLTPGASSSSIPYQRLGPVASGAKDLKDAFLLDPTPSPSYSNARTPTSPMGPNGTPPTHRYAGVERLATRHKIYDPAGGLLMQTLSPTAYGYPACKETDGVS